MGTVVVTAASGATVRQRLEAKSIFNKCEHSLKAINKFYMETIFDLYKSHLKYNFSFEIYIYVIFKWRFNTEKKALP